MKIALEKIKKISSNKRKYIWQEVNVLIKEGKFSEARELLETKDAKKTYSSEFITKKLEEIDKM